MNRTRRTVSAPWWLWIIAVDVFLFIMTALYPNIPDFYGKSRLLGPFTLTGEMKIATWWSGISFMVLSFIAYELFCTENGVSERTAWLSLSVLLTALFSDEIGSLHERVGSFSRLLPYGVVAVSLLAYSLVLLYRKTDTRKIAILIFSGFMLFALVAVMEKLEHSLTWPGWARGIRAGIEEGTELVGTFLIFWGVVMQRQSGRHTSWQNAIPNLQKMRHIDRIILCGMFLHVIASVILPRVVEMSASLGNPLVLYPAAVYIMLSLGSLQQYLNSEGRRRKTFALVSVFFAICSLGSMFDLFQFLPKVSLIMPQRYIATFYSLLVVQLVVVVFLILRGSALFKDMKMMLLYVLLAVLLIGFSARGVIAQSIVSGVIVTLFALVFLPRLTTRHAASQVTEIAGPEPAKVS